MIRKLVRTHMGSNRPLTQVDRIVLLFGGVGELQKALEAVGKPKRKFTLYRWNYSRARGGADGVIPSSAMTDIFAAARHMGILLTAEHLDPRPSFGDAAREIVEDAKNKAEDPE